MPHPLAEHWEKAFATIPETGRYLLAELKAEFAQDQVILIFPNGWAQSYFAETYYAGVQTKIAELSGKDIKLDLRISDTVTQKSSDSRIKPADKGRTGPGRVFTPEPVYPLKLIPDFAFEKFVVGESNRDAFEAALALAKRQEGYKAVLLTGLVGTGKSHLLGGAYGCAAIAYPDSKILPCVLAKDFRGEFSRLAMEKNRSLWERFNKIYFGSDIVFFDDIQRLAGAIQTMAQLKDIIDSVLFRNGASIMLTSQPSLKDLESMFMDSVDKNDKDVLAKIRIVQELISRLRAFLIVEIKPPDFDLKVAILVKKASEGPTPFNLDIGLARAIAKRVTVPDIRPLVGAVSSLKLRVSRGAVVDSELINELLGEVPQKQLDPDTITNIVAEHFFVSVEEILSKIRFKPVVRARHIAFYLCREFLMWISITELGRYFKRDHSSIINGTDKIADRIKTDPDLQKELLAIESKIRSQEK